jgi:serine phosphatase RsbU (regulator of sigma subunit)
MNEEINKTEKSNSGISILTGMMVLVVAAVTLAGISFCQLYYSHKSIKKEISLRAASELSDASSQIMDIVNQAEAAVRNSIWISELCLKRLDTLARVPMRVVKDNPVVMGSTIALVPGYSKRHLLYAPYAVMDSSIPEGVRMLSLATEEYDYPSKEWFTQALKETDGYWSEPYYDEGGANALMTTFSLPVKDSKGQIAAVLTADISLEWLGNVVTDFKMYPNAVSTIVSRAGNQLIKAGKDLPEKMTAETYSTEVERTGWTLIVTIPEKDLFANVRKVGLVMILLSFLGLFMLFIILKVVAHNIITAQKGMEQRERMESELRISHDIQMSMVPQTFPPFPDRKDLDFAACIVPAKEVGGDLYDYFIRDQKLFFCIGDVSGKGVPASLVMTVACTLFRAISGHESSPALIVSAMNKSLNRNNSKEMFVTFFLGTLDLVSGELRYCNAGHNPPLILTDDIRQLPGETNLPLGIVADFEYKENSIVLRPDDALFLYTDGVTEAENAQAELFGEERMTAVLRGGRKDSAEHLTDMQAAVSEFVGEAPQSDDLTMLFIHYLGNN